MVITLDLSRDEQRMLREMLDDDLSILRMQIEDARTREFRERVKRRKVVLLRVIRALQPASEAPARRRELRLE